MEEIENISKILRIMIMIKKKPFYVTHVYGKLYIF